MGRAVHHATHGSDSCRTQPRDRIEHRNARTDGRIETDLRAAAQRSACKPIQRLGGHEFVGAHHTHAAFEKSLTPACSGLDAAETLDHNIGALREDLVKGIGQSRNRRGPLAPFDAAHQCAREFIAIVFGQRLCERGTDPAATQERDARRPWWR